MNWSLLPKDNPEQLLRIRRMLLAGVASAIVVVLTGVGAWLHFLPYATFWRLALMALMLVAGFYACFRSGLNLRMSDPSLTTPMLVAAGLVISIVQADAGEARSVLMLLYPVVFMFGVFRLRRRALVVVALLFSVFYAVAIGASVWSYHLALDLRHEMFRVVFLTAVLVWFAYIGGNFSEMRQELSRANDELRIAFEKVETLANLDALTGAYSRRYLMAQLEREGNRAERGSTLSIGMMDLDHFKSVNDTYGHACGDEVLKGFCATAQGALREIDILGRYGGEEFVVVFPQTSGASAALVAERIRKLVEQSMVPCLRGEKRVTVSIGVAEHRSPDSVQRTLERADAAMFKAKSTGRNRVELAD